MSARGSLHVHVNPSEGATQGVPLLMPDVSWDRLQPCGTLYKDRQAQIMDGCTECVWEHTEED